jgi:hypothetical protein
MSIVIQNDQPLRSTADEKEQSRCRNRVCAP